MTIPTQRLEAAARLWCELDPLSPAPDAPISWNMKPAKAWEPRAELLRQVCDRVLCPGVFADPPTAWVAPWEATDSMAYEGEGYADFMLPEGTHDNTKEGRIREMKMAYGTMRDSHLSAGEEGKHEQERGK